jgi:hypothetical protein
MMRLTAATELLALHVAALAVSSARIAPDYHIRDSLSLM